MALMVAAVFGLVGSYRRVYQPKDLEIRRLQTDLGALAVLGRLLAPSNTAASLVAPGTPAARMFQAMRASSARGTTPSVGPKLDLLWYQFPSRRTRHYHSPSPPPPPPSLCIGTCLDCPSPLRSSFPCPPRPVVPSAGYQLARTTRVP